MTERSSGPASSGASPPNNIRAATLDAIDRRILDHLANDARIPNNALAERVGVAPSTCLARIRSLQARGVIRGYFADIDPVATGRSIQAMIAVRLRAHARGHIGVFAAKVAKLRPVLNVFFLAGPMDFYLHVATTTPQELRDFVVVSL
ncbi:MAG TPA: Lrp/AsnC family transcriptional regulator, partial [Streptosporangiales bacterium]